MCTKYVYGQFGVSDTLYKDLNKLRITQKDTIIRFALPDPHDIYFDTLQGIGKVTKISTEYLIYKKDSIIYIKKYVNYFDKNNLPTISLSNPLEVKRDSTLSLLLTCMTQIKNEQIYPYIYNYKIKGYSHFNVLRTSHEAQWLIGIYTLDNDLVKNINDLGLKKDYHDFPENLNYAANQSTKLKSIFMTLSEYITRVDKLFKFD